MKVALHKSFSAKLFMLMLFCLLMTVAGNSWQNASMFHDYLIHRVEDSSVQKAREVANSVASVIEGWAGQIAVAMHGIVGMPRAQMARAADNFVTSNKEYVAFQVLTIGDDKLEELAFSFTGNKNDSRFGDVSIDALTTRLRSASSGLVKRFTDKPVELVNLGPSTGLPLTAVAMKFVVRNESGKVAYSRSGRKSADKVIWGILTVWQTRLISTMPFSDSVRSELVNLDGTTFVTPTAQAVRSTKPAADSRILGEALKGNAPFGFKSWSDAEQIPRLGAFAGVPQYGMSVVVETDGRSAQIATTRIIARTALWALLFLLIAIMLSYFVSSGITQNLRRVVYATMRIARGEFITIQPTSQDEVGVLSLAVSHMSKQIEGLMQSEIQKARFEKELETAGLVQNSFFPMRELKTDFVKISASYQPASECCGDWWGYYSPAPNEYFIFIADATGHGVPAALVTAIVFAGTNLIAKSLDPRQPAAKRLEKVVSELNQITTSTDKSKLTMTLFAAHINTDTGVLTYVNAGHNFPILLPHDQSEERFKAGGDLAGMKPKRNQCQIKIHGNPLGVFADSEFKAKAIQLRGGDKVLFYTDGLIECSNPAGEQWGRKNFAKILEAEAQLGGEELKQRILQTSASFFAEKPIDDDITLVVLEMARDFHPTTQASPEDKKLIAS